MYPGRLVDLCRKCVRRQIYKCEGRRKVEEVVFKDEIPESLRMYVEGHVPSAWEKSHGTGLFLYL